MFETLSERLSTTLNALTGKGVLTDENITSSLREVRLALLEADVALPVVKRFIEQVKTNAVGMQVTKSLSPGQVFLKIVNEELVTIMGSASSGLDMQVQPPAVILMAGLQGVGKTTSVAKLARWLKQHEKKTVMVASTDVYRPAAIDQLQTLAQTADLLFHASDTSQKPAAIARAALAAAKKQFADVLIIDTAGRLHVDGEMMQEISSLHEILAPAETLFVVDAMTGQDAANTAKAFSDELPLTGVILTKTDGDARGGAALSVRYITERPIKFISSGEGLDTFDVFHPERIASRILGMGDVLSLIEEAEQKIDKKKAEKLAKKIKKGRNFDLDDFRDQIQQMNNMGGLAGMLDKLPGTGQMGQAAKDRVSQQNFVQQEAIICSMTARERRFPDVIAGSRKKRIARGSGTQIQDVNRLLKQHKQMQKMMKKLGRKGGMSNMMRGMQGMMQQGGPRV